MAFFVAVLIVCSGVAYHFRGITAGVVVQKQFFPEHWETNLQPIPDGKGGFDYVPYDELVPDRWTILIQGINGSGVEVQSRIEVSPQEYAAIQVGEHYGVESGQ